MRGQMKLRTIIEAGEAIQHLLDLKLPLKVSYSIQRTVRPLLEELRTFENARDELIRTMGKPDETGAVKVAREQMPTFLKEVNELLDLEIDVSITKISLEDLSGELSVRDMLLLEFLIEG